MKKLCILFIVLLTLHFNLSAFAATQTNTLSSDTSILYISEDLYIEITITEDIVGTNTRSTSNTKTATKLGTIKNNNNEVLASYKLTATFTYDGVTSSCTNVSETKTIYDDSWKFTSSSCSKSGSTATGTFTAKKSVLFVTVQTVEKTLTLTCDKNGNIS